MVTGIRPFEGETRMQIAAQQLHGQPPSPRMFRPELPETAEQVMLKTMAKRPGDRYTNALEFATAFRLALQGLEIQQQATQSNTFVSSGITASGLFAPHLLFDPK